MPQVQLGDHVVFFNSIMYGLLSDGAWSLENAIVVGVESEWASLDMGDTIEFLGHGRAHYVRAHSARACRATSRHGRSARKRVKNAPAAATTVPWLRPGAPLVRWAPYDETWIASRPVTPRAPGGSGYRLTRRGLEGTRARRGRDDRTLPDAVRYTTAKGFTSPPPTVGGFGPANAVYFPLWQPAQQGKWNGYIERRRNGETPSDFQLEVTRIDRATIPGLVVPRQILVDRRVVTIRPFVAR